MPWYTSIANAFGFSAKTMPVAEKKGLTAQEMMLSGSFGGVSVELARIASSIPAAQRQRIQLITHNPIAHMCMRRISWGVGGVKWLVDGKDSGDIYDLLNKPKSDDRFGLFTLIAASLAATGNAYLIKTERASGRKEKGPAALHFLRPDRISLHYENANGKLTRYEYQTDDNKVRNFSPEAVCHIRHPWLLDDYVGESVLEPAFDAISVHAGFMKLRRKLLDNSGGIPTALVFEGDQAMSAEQREELQDLLQDFKLDGDSFGSILLLDAGVVKGKVNKIDLAGDIESMNPVETVGKTEEQIAQLFGVPRLLLGVGGDATYANQKEARRYFWLDTVIPGYITPIASCLSTFLDVEIEADLDAIPALADHRLEVIGLLKQADWLTINEKREWMGFDKVDGGDDVLQPASLIPISDPGGTGGDAEFGAEPLTPGAPQQAPAGPGGAQPAPAAPGGNRPDLAVVSSRETFDNDITG